MWSVQSRKWAAGERALKHPPVDTGDLEVLALSWFAIVLQENIK
jgi:hypothetical protein